MSSSDLSTYQLQLQQVEVALTTEPDNQELIKLKEDLEQVMITLYLQKLQCICYFQF